MLTSLTSLDIRDVDMEGVDSFPEEEGQLPTTLTYLELDNIRNLKSLNGRALRHLTSLKSLEIVECKQLQCLPEERLPASLSELIIEGCPMLKPRCQRGIGEDWDTIHHIPYIWIDGESRILHSGLRIGSFENVEEVEDVSFENVEEVEDVSKANLKNKNYITDLRLEWNDESSDVSHNKAREVLDRLQPHTNLAELHIQTYRGRSFLDWIGHHSFCCLTYLNLEGCKNCDRLPPLGELPFLKYLRIYGFDMVERIGNEFYLSDSSSSSPPFKSLKRLIFENMGEWKEWSSVGGAFPNLMELELRRCPKLKGACLPDINLPSLEDLRIWDNHHVVASLSRCQFPSLRFLRIYNCGGMKSFPLGRLPSTKQSIGIEGFDDWESLSEDMEGVDSFPEEEGQLPTTLTSLCLYSLRNLKSLNGRALRHLTSLKSLWIWNCEQLQCLPEERLPASLSELSIYGCPLLKPRCQRGIGQDWDTIHHIPNIWIDSQRI